MIYISPKFCKKLSFLWFWYFRINE